VAKREIKGFAGLLKLRGQSPVWLHGTNLLRNDPVRIVSSGKNVWEGSIVGTPRPVAGGYVKALAMVSYKGDGTYVDEFPIRPFVDEDLGTLTVTVGPVADPDADTIVIPNVVIDGP